MSHATASLPAVLAPSDGTPPLEGAARRRVLAPINAILAAYLVVLIGLALAAWAMGHGSLESAFVFGAFLAANAALSALAWRNSPPVRVEIARLAAGALLAPAAYLLAGDPFMRWWPAFLILCLGGTVLLSLHSGSTRFARPLTAYYVALYLAAEFLAPAPHDWYMVAMNAGAIAFVALLFGEVVAFLGATLAREREQRAQLAAEKARSETMLQKEAADALRASEAHYRSLLENAFDITTIVDRDGTFLYASDNFERELGWKKGEVLGTPYMPLVHPEDLPPVMEKLQSALAAPGRVVSMEVRAHHRDGSWRWFESVCKSTAEGTLVASSRNITARRQAEGALQRLNSELEQRVAERTAELQASLAETRRLAAIIEATSDYVGIADLQGRGVYVNRAGQRMVGKRREDMQGADVTRCYPERALPKAGEMLAAALRGEVWSGELALLHADGHEIPVSEVTFALPGADGRPQYLATIIRDISEQKRAEAELKRAKDAAEAALTEQRRLTEILEATSDFVGMADPTGRVLYINRAGKAMLGLAPTADVRALGFQRLFDPETEARMFSEGVPTGLRDGAWITEVDFLHVSGRRIPTSFVGLVHKGSDGRPELLSCIARDITELRRTEKQLRRAKDAAEAANRAKSAFLANMSHEIRTPMNAVVGMTSLLLETPLSPRQREFVETVRTSGDALLTIINDILDFSKIEAEKLDLVEKPFDVREAVEAALDLLAPRASEKGLEIGYLIEDGVPAGVLGDVTRLRQILVNLIGNAVKFTAAGEVFVSVRARRSDAGARPLELQFSVRDTGAGIPPERIDRLFRPFSQLDASNTREFGGTGLGLAISKRLAELMGGRIWIESEGVPGRGATFHFTLATEEVASPARSRRAQPLPTLRGRRLLVVDDNATNRRILSLQAQTWGMLVAEAASPGEALALVRGGADFDLAILDMHMPEPHGGSVHGREGVALAQALCAHSGAARLPLVMLTSIGDGPDPDAEALTCFAAYLSKPIKPSQLHDVLVQVLAEGCHHAPPADDPAPIEQLAERLPLRILVAEDVLVNQRFALLALERMGYRADVAANGLEVLAALHRQCYDVVLMDVQMPECDGLEATRRIRGELPADRQPQIVAMTANAMQGDRELCLQAGMDDYISKPVYLEELRAALERAGERSRSASPAAHCRTAVLDPRTLAELRRRPDALDLVALYLSDAARIVADLKRAAGAHDRTALAQSAHALKGASAYVGAQRLVVLCREIEREARAGSLEGVAQRIVDAEFEFRCVQEALDQSHAA